MIEDQDPTIQAEPEPRLAPVVGGYAVGGTATGALRRSAGLRAGLVVLLLLALAVPVVIAVNGNGRGDSNGVRAFAPGASAAPQASANSGTVPDKPGPARNPGPKNGPGKPGPGPKAPGGKGPGAPGKGPITISAIDGSDLSLKTDDGWTRTITVTSDTTITKGGQTITVSDLKVGDEIGFRQTRNADGSYTITAIVVPTPKAGGEVSAISGNTITIKQKGGSTRDITVTSSTVYTLGPKAAGSKSDVKVGSRIDAEGTVSGDTFTATAIHIALAHTGGTVTAKTGSSITLKRPDGTTIVIHVSSSTTYAIKGNATGSLADIAIGDRVEAQGTANDDGSLDALNVHSGPAKPPKGPNAKPKPAPNASTTPG